MAISATLDKGLTGKPHLRTVGSTVAVSCFTIGHVLSVNLAGKRKIVSWKQIISQIKPEDMQAALLNLKILLRLTIDGEGGDIDFNFGPDSQSLSRWLILYAVAIPKIYFKKIMYTIYTICKFSSCFFLSFQLTSKFYSVEVNSSVRFFSRLFFPFCE